VAATTITWIYAAHLEQAPGRRSASENTTEFAFADARRALAKHLAHEGVGIDCQDTGKSGKKPLTDELSWTSLYRQNGKLQLYYVLLREYGLPFRH
jgi:hypothetical protein